MRQVSLLAVCLLGFACSPTDEPTVAAVNMPPAYAGAAACSGCHETEFNLWRESHHALATMLRDQGKSGAAREIAEGLAARYPGVPSIQNLLDSL